jgi:galactonate dehydratase
MQIAEVESLLVAGGHYVRITTDTGLVGLGQSAAWAYPAATDQVIRAFRRYLIGQDPLRIEHHW